MEYAAVGPSLIGRRVRILAWADLSELFQHYSRYGLMPSAPQVGMVTGVDDYGEGHLEIRLRMEGFARSFVFDGYELELLS